MRDGQRRSAGIPSHAADLILPAVAGAAGLRIQADSLVVLVGPSGSGKSTFAARHFPRDAVLSSDEFRARVSGDEADQSATEAAFRLLHAEAEGRLKEGRLTVIDATNVLRAAREPLLALAEGHGRPSVAITFELTLDDCLAWNASRPSRVVPSRVVRRQYATLLRAVPHLAEEGFRVERLRDVGQVAAATVIVGE